MSCFVLCLPAVYECGLNSIPVACACSILSESSANAVLPILGRHCGEVPGYGLLACVGVFLVSLYEYVLGLLSSLEGNYKAHSLSHCLCTCLGGYAPVDERLCSSLVSFACVGVYTPIVLCTCAETLVSLVAYADVDREHAEILVLEAAFGYSAVLPAAVLEEYCVAVDELCLRLCACLGSQLAGLAGGVVDVEIPDVLVVLKVGALDSVGIGDAVSLILEVDGEVCEVGLESPVGGAVHTSGGEGSLYAESLSVLLDFLSNSLELVKAVEIVDLLNGSEVRLEILVEKCLVVDKAIGLDYISDTINLAVFLQSVVLGGELVVDVGAGKILAEVFPLSKTNGAVNLEQGGSLVALSHFGSKGLLVGTFSSGNYGYLSAGLLGILLREILPCLILLGLEVQIVNLAAFCVSLGLGL